jgi:hypothetical protein
MQSNTKAYTEFTEQRVQKKQYLRWVSQKNQGGKAILSHDQTSD